MNCTKEELDNITTNFPDTKLVGYTGNLSYAVTYKLVQSLTLVITKDSIFYCRFQCKTFGKNFKPSGSFYSSVSTTCQNSKLWSVTTIPDPCVWSHCVDPPPPPSASKLELSWDSSDPPAHDETVWYRCKAGNQYNRLETDFSKTGYALTCLKDNKFSTPAWPVCIDSKV